MGQCGELGRTVNNSDHRLRQNRPRTTSTIVRMKLLLRKYHNSRDSGPTGHRIQDPIQQF